MSSLKPTIHIFEGTWWSTSEVPLVLPYFQALAGSHGGFALSHRTIRSAQDIAYYVKRLRRGEQAFLYFACHGEEHELFPSGKRSRITRAQLADALSCRKPDSIAFVHFGCCEIIERAARRRSLQELLDASGARWVSGYTESVGWLPSTMLDLALVAELYVPFHRSRGPGGARLKRPAKDFLREYEQFARGLGFSGLSRDRRNRYHLFPQRLRA